MITTEKIQTAILRFLCFWCGHDYEPYDVFEIQDEWTTVMFSQKCDTCGYIKEAVDK